MRVPAGVLLSLCLGALWAVSRRGLADYAAFKRLTQTRDRQRQFLKWVGKSFLLFSGTSVICLFVLGRLGAVLRLPPEFAALQQRLRSVMPSPEPNHDFLIGFGGALVAGLIGGLVFGIALAKKRRHDKKPKQMMIGDIAPLMPRNAAETWCTALLSANAGLGEELFFRLVLPLLMTLLIGKMWVGFVLASVIFGLEHRYQGWAGIIVTTVLGMVFTVLYLWTGSLLAVMCIHAGFDMVGLVVRPTIMRVLQAKYAKAVES